MPPGQEDPLANLGPPGPYKSIAARGSIAGKHEDEEFRASLFQRLFGGPSKSGRLINPAHRGLGVGGFANPEDEQRKGAGGTGAGSLLL